MPRTRHGHSSGLNVLTCECYRAPNRANLWIIIKFMDINQLPVMTDQREKIHTDTTLEDAKRESQARSRALVESGVRTQESMFLIAPALVKEIKVRHRTTDF